MKNLHILCRKQKREAALPLFRPICSLQSQLPAAVVADALVLVQGDFLVAAAENAAGLMLSQNDRVALGIDLQRIAASHIQGLAQFDGQSDAAQIVDMSDNASRFHNKAPPK